MAEICNPECDLVQIREYPIPCDRVEATRKGGFSRYILLDCDVDIDDITDEAEWAAIKTAGKLIVSPPGFGELETPEQKTEQLDACGPEEVIDEISGVKFDTKLFDNTTYMDFDFENDVKAKGARKSIMWLGCDGLLYHRYNWTTGTNPGFSGLAPRVYRDSKPSELQRLHTDFKFNTYQKGLNGILVSQDVLDAIFN